MPNEFFDDAPRRDLSQVRRLAERAVALESQIQDLEFVLKKYKADLLILRRDLIPDAMAEHGLSEFKLEDGSHIAVKPFIAGVLPKTPLERTFAIRLLEEHGGEALIKNELTVSFDKKDHNRAVALAEELKAAGYDANIESTVHHMQLSAWCREKVRNGEKLEFEKLGVFVGRDTTITLPEKS